MAADRARSAHQPARAAPARARTAGRWLCKRESNNACQSAAGRPVRSSPKVLTPSVSHPSFTMAGIPLPSQDISLSWFQYPPAVSCSNVPCGPHNAPCFPSLSLYSSTYRLPSSSPSIYFSVVSSHIHSHLMSSLHLALIFRPCIDIHSNV